MITAREVKEKKRSGRKKFGEKTGLLDCNGLDLCIGDNILFIRPNHIYNKLGERIYFGRAVVCGSSKGTEFNTIKYSYIMGGKRKVSSTKYMERIFKL